MKLATKAIHAAQPSDPSTGALVAPIFQTSTYQQQAPGVNQGFEYTRTNNPTRQRLEHVLAELEGAHHAAVFSSGLAAENAIFQALLKPGAEIIIPPDVYGGTHRLLNQVFEPRGVIVTPVDYADLDAVERALSSRPRILWLETPTNPRLLIYDIEALSRIAHDNGVVVVVDNTFATPVFQLPFEFGVDIVLHSVTKYLSGHSDVIQGAVLTRDPDLFEEVKYLQNACGAVPSPFDCWLTLRGLKTLDLRVRRHAESAQRIAEAVVDHPAVDRVYYPGLKSHPGHEIAARQMTGFGGMVSLELRATADQVRRFVSDRRYFALAESLGGVKALICHPATMTHAAIAPEVRAGLGLSDSLVRLSPGVEDPEDLLEDVLTGLDAIAAYPPQPSHRVAVNASIA